MIAASIINKKEFKRLAGGFEALNRPLNQFLQVVLFVIDGGNY
jgi:hypothetical protein